MTVQQASGESHGSEDDMVKRKVLNAQAPHDLELLFNPPPAAQQWSPLGVFPFFSSGVCFK